MTLLSVNLNKIALLRNVRATGDPSVVEAARLSLQAGAGGITVHPRPDARHTRSSDVHALAVFLRSVPGAEFNIEDNPLPDFLRLVMEVRPTQCTLVPDSVDAVTSDHGWDLEVDGERLRPIVRALQAEGIRVSVFLDPVEEQVRRARDLGADRIELYTEPYAAAFGAGDASGQLERFAHAGVIAASVGLGVNAGHDLNAANVGPFCSAVPNVLEVSIGHALVGRALEIGMHGAIAELAAELPMRH
jgi:pyridoxine 5-phosphate synthase